MPVLNLDMHPPQHAPEALVFDVVCGQVVTVGASLVVRYLERDYYLCSAHCKSAFEKDPSRYASSRAFGPYH